MFAEAIRKKIIDFTVSSDSEYALWIEPNNFNIIGMLDCVSKYISRLGSVLDTNDTSVRYSNTYIKQRAFYDEHHKSYGISFLTLYIPSGLMAETFRIVSGRHNDRKILQCSEIYNFIYNLKKKLDYRNYAFYRDKAFWGA